MGWKQFIASIVGDVAWPLVLLTIVIIFYKQICYVFAHLKTIGAGGVRLELAAEIDEAQANIEKLAAAEKKPQVFLGIKAKEMQERFDSLQTVAETAFPAGAILFAWKEIEALLIELKFLIDPSKPHRNSEEVLRVLIKGGFVSSAILDAYQSLRKVRNTIVHTPDAEKMTRGEVLELLGQLSLLSNVLRSTADQLKNKKPAG